MQRLKPHLPILLITLAGLVLRLWNAGSMSLNNDELSALYRLQFDNIADVWNDGVRLDGHPAFVQTFLWLWLKITPHTVFFLRLPFMIAGTLAIPFVYRIGKAWFGEVPGLFAAATLSVMEFTILYSQLARPYAFGLFFVSAMAWYWWQIISSPSRPRWPLLLAVIVFTTLCFYTHYFCFLTALIIGATGLLIVRGRRWIIYLVIASAAGLLFLPHLTITLYQLQVGGVGGWLGEPGYAFPINYLLYIFDNSAWILALAALVLAWAWLQPGANGTAGKPFLSSMALRSICLVWGTLPLLIGFIYSRKFNPVLQYSVLIFSLPFLLLFIFSFTATLRPVAGRWLVCLYMLAGIGVTALPQGRNYYGRYHFGEYKGLADSFSGWKKTYGDSITTIALINNPFYLRYYFPSGDPADRYYMKPGPQLKHIRRYISSCATPQLAFGWTNTYCPPELPEMIAEVFPYCLEYRPYYNAGVYRFSKEPGNPAKHRDTVHTWYTGFDAAAPWLSISPELKDTLIGSNTFLLQHMEFGPTFTLPAKDLMEHSWNIVHARTRIIPADSACNPQLVLAIERDGKTVYWTSRTWSDQAWPYAGNFMYLSERMSMKELQAATDKVKIYIWNPGNSGLYIDDLRIWVEEGNPYLYGYD